MYQNPIDSHVVLCTLEDFYHGCIKRVTLKRTVRDDFGRLNNKEEMLKLKVLPGWKHGTKLEFGNQLTVVLHKKPHALFKRVESDLIMTKQISLLEALVGTTFNLTTLNRRDITIQVNNIVTPSYQKIVYGEGMPLHRDPNKRGKLIINFDIVIPSLTTKQKSDVRRILNDVVYD